MKSIRRVALAIALALIFVAGVNAQDYKDLFDFAPPHVIKEGSVAPSCQVKVVVVYQNWDGSGENQYGRMTANQVEWWRLEGQKKFPGICLVSTKDEADYGIAWKALQSADKYTYTVPHTETTQHQGTVNTNSSSRSTTSPDTVYSSGSGTYRGTSTTTTYENKDGEWPVTYVSAAVLKNGGDDIPLFVAKHKGQWRWSKPDKDAFEKSLKFIQKQLK